MSYGRNLVRLQLAIGLFLGFAAIFRVLGWLRFRWYLTKWPDEAAKMPIDVRCAILRSLVKKFQRLRPTMTDDQKSQAAVALMSWFGPDSPPFDTETLSALIVEAGNLWRSMEKRDGPTKEPLLNLRETPSKSG
jgi:hypothetical protein